MDVKFTDLANMPFTEGQMSLLISWPNGQGVTFSSTIPQLQPKEHQTIGLGETRALAEGFGLIFCIAIRANDSQQVNLLDAQRRRVVPEVAIHSIRKFFRTQLAALGVNRDYIEYMMGHKISAYHDVKMKGVEFLRNIYAASGLSIRPKTNVSKIEALKEIIRAWGMDPEEILTKKALAEPHRVYAGPRDREEDQVKALSSALKDMMRRELLNDQGANQ